MKIRELPPGTRFRYPGTGRVATLVRLGEMGATIKYDNSERHVQINTAAGDVAEFEAPGRPIIVSDYSDVEVL